MDLTDTFVLELENVARDEGELDVTLLEDELLLTFWEEVVVGTFVEDVEEILVLVTTWEEGVLAVFLLLVTKEDSVVKRDCTSVVVAEGSLELVEVVRIDKLDDGDSVLSFARVEFKAVVVVFGSNKVESEVGSVESVDFKVNALLVPTKPGLLIEKLKTVVAVLMLKVDDCELSRLLELDVPPTAAVETNVEELLWVAAADCANEVLKVTIVGNPGEEVAGLEVAKDNGELEMLFVTDRVASADIENEELPVKLPERTTGLEKLGIDEVLFEVVLADVEDSVATKTSDELVALLNESILLIAEIPEEVIKGLLLVVPGEEESTIDMTGEVGEVVLEILAIEELIATNEVV